MLLVPRGYYKPHENVNSYDGATTLHALVAALSKLDRDDWVYPLKHPVPSPEAAANGRDATDAAAAARVAAANAATAPADDADKFAAFANAMNEAAAARVAAARVAAVNAANALAAANAEAALAGAEDTTAPNVPTTDVGAWYHGKLTEEIAEQRVKAAKGKESGYFLISKRPNGFKDSYNHIGEFWLSISVYRDPDTDVQHFPITTDPDTNMLLIRKRTFWHKVHSYDGATTLRALVDALSKPRGDWYYPLTHPVPSPEPQEK
jgi:hypothetical protein